MATVEIELRKYQKRKTKVVNGEKVVTVQKDGLLPLVMRVTSGDNVSRKNTGLYIKAAEWDENKRRVNRRHPEWTRLNDALDKLCRDAEGAKADAITNGAAVVPSVVLKEVFSTRDFYEAAEERKKTFLAMGKYNTPKNYDAMIMRLKEFAPKLTIEQITPKFIESYRAHLKGLGKKHNTIVYHLTKIKAVLNGVDLKGPNPFDKVVKGSYRSSKAQVLTMEDIDKIGAYITGNVWERIARDAFLFSFYAAGMSSSDILQLTWDQVTETRINFGRNKVQETSDVQLSLPINKVLKEILKRQDRSKKSVFNLVTMFGEGKEACKEREVIQASINRALKRIAKHTEIERPISFKMARTAFAQIANELSGRNVYGISMALGHTKLGTTEIYLGNDGKAIDELCKVVYG